MTHIVQILLTLLSLGVVTLIGFVREYGAWRAVERRLQFATGFANKFIELGQAYLASSFDHERHRALVLESERMQRELGPRDLISYKPAFRNYIHHRYPMLSNTLHAMHVGSAQTADVVLTQDILISYVGALKQRLEDQEATYRNPAMWFASGVRAIVILPWFLLRSFGLVSAATLDSAWSSRLARLLGLGVGVVGLVGSVVTIVLGWHAFIVLLHL